MAVDESDHLTQLFSRAAFDSALPKHFSEATIEQPASLIFADIDYFKKINDDHGHQAGDSVLKEFGHRLRQTIEGKGAAYRYGGDEFAAILPNHTANEALAVAERARLVVQGTKVGGFSVTSTYGVAVAPLHAVSSDQWLQEADKALYEAKRLGRNLVRISGEPPPQSREVRRPARKVPEAGTLSDDAKEELRLQILRQGRALCPHDQIPLEIRDRTNIREPGRSFLVRCPGCGFQTDLPGPGR